MVILTSYRRASAGDRAGDEPGEFCNVYMGPRMLEPICYQKSFLKQVIAKVDFATPLVKLEKGVPSGLVDAIIKYFPIIEPPADLISQEIIFEGGGVNTKQTTIKHWIYFGKDRGKQLTLAPQNISVVYTTYSSYEETKAQFGAVIEALSKSFPDTKVARFGLRYINQIEFQLSDPTEWNDFIDPSLIASRRFFGSDDALTRLLTLTELNYGDIGVRFQFGMPNQDYPAQLKRAQFVLDLDASVSQAHDLADVLSRMDESHRRIQELFERSITEKLRRKMDAKPVQQ